MAGYNLFVELRPELAADFTPRAEALITKAMSRINPKVKISVDGAEGASAKLAEVSRDRTSKIKIDVDKGGLDKLGSFGLNAAGALTALKGVGIALAPVLVSVGSSAALAGASVAAIGPAAIGAATGLSAIKLAFSPVLDSVTKHIQLQKSNNAISAVSAAQQVSQANSIKSAQASITSAQYTLIDSQKAAKKAQLGINEARKEAIQDLKDLREAALDYKNSEEDASIALARAKEEQAGINSSTTATLLDKREAAAHTADAEQKLHEIQTKRTENTVKLADAEKKGVEHSDKVVEAQDKYQKALHSTVEAQNSLKGAQASLVQAQAATVASNAKMADSNDGLSKSGIRLRDQLVSLHDRMTLFGEAVQDATLPGFSKFLDDILVKGNSGKSAVDLLEGAVLGMGRTFSGFASQVGDFVKSDFFKSSFSTIIKNNQTAVEQLSDAGIKMLKPLTSVFVAASPLVLKFTGYIKELSDKFAIFIDKHAKDGSLKKFFKDSGVEMDKWWRIAKNLGGILVDIFKAALPDADGKDIVTRLGDFTQKIKGFTDSEAGQRKIHDFFEFFQHIDYGKIAKIALAAGSVALLFKGGAISLKHPMFTIMGLVAAKYPQETADVLNSVADALGKTLGWFIKHPTEAKIAVGFFGALAGLKAIGDIKIPDFGNSISKALGKVGLSGLTQRGSTPANPLFVVDINGGIDIPGKRAGKKGGKAAKGAATAAEDAAEDVGKVASKGGKFGKVLGFGAKAAELLDPLTWAALGTSIAADSGVLGKKGSTGKALGQGAGATLTGAAIGAAAGSIVPGVGTVIGGAVGAVAGAGYSLFKSATLRKDFMKYVGSPIASFFTKTIPNLFKGLPGKISDFFKSLPGRIGGFFKQLPFTIAHAAGNIVGLLIIGVVKGIPALYATITNMAGNVASFIGKGIDKAVDFITALPSRAWTGIKMLGDNFHRGADLAAGWIQKLPGRVIDFLKDLPDRIWGIIKRIPGFFKSIWDSAKSFVASGVNGIIHLVNSFLEGIEGVTGKFGVHLFTKKPPIGDIAAKADGGTINGHSPHPRADNILIRATAGEFMQPVSAVQHYGKPFMEAIRNKSLPRFAGGGSIDEIIGAARKSGLNLGEITTNPAGYHGSHHDNDGGYHSKSLAVDFGRGGVGQTAIDALAQYFYSNYGSKLLEEIHTRPSGDSGWFVKNGKKVDPSFYQSELIPHETHVHIAANEGFTKGILGRLFSAAKDFVEGLASPAINALVSPLVPLLAGKLPPFGSLAGGIMKKLADAVGQQADSNVVIGDTAVGDYAPSSQAPIAGGALDDIQKRNAAAIMGQASNKRIQTIGIMTALAESTLYNQASRKVPASLKYPHDSVAKGDHLSVGLFQQQPWWGDTADLMNPAHSARLFYDALARKGTASTMYMSAQNVQQSAYKNGSNYHAQEDRAKAITGYKGFAAGGYMPANQWNVVGERGPELLKIGSPGHVLSNHDSKRMISSREVTNNFYGDINEPVDAAMIAAKMNATLRMM